MLRRTLTALAAPIGLVLLAMALVPFVESWTDGKPLWREYLAGGFVLLAMALSWAFHQTRMLFLVTVTALLLWVLQPGTWTTLDLIPPATDRMPVLVACLLPLNLVAFPLLKERGLLTWRGGLRTLTVMLQPVLAITLQRHAPDALISLLAANHLPLNLGGMTSVPQIALALYLLAGVTILVKALRDQSAVNAGFLGILTGSFLALHAYTSVVAVQSLTAAIAVGGIAAIILNGYRMAYRDELTGLAGRRALRELLLKLPSKYSIAMLDIDHFKRFNDRYGHDIGDQVLKMVAGQIQRTRGGGRAFRYGGEEFTLVFPGKLADETVALLDGLRIAVADAGFTLRSPSRPERKPKKKSARNPSRSASRQVRVTISIGVADSRRSDGGPEAVIKAADQALYRAKRRGRNRVEH